MYWRGSKYFSQTQAVSDKWRAPAPTSPGRGRKVSHVRAEGLRVIFDGWSAYEFGFARFLRIESPRISIRCAL